MKIRYNSPLILSFSFLAIIIFIIDSYLYSTFITHFFVAPSSQVGFSFVSPLSYFKFFSHVLGHGSWDHLLGNLMFILLLGPILEEKYGSSYLLIMFLITAGATGLCNVLFFSTGLLGASGIVFMMIILSSFTNYKLGEIPLTFILVAFMFITREVLNSFVINNVAEFAHIVGGLMGSVFGFIMKEKN